MGARRLIILKSYAKSSWDQPQLMNTSSIFEYLFNKVTVADPIKLLAPKVSTFMGDAPTTTSNLSYKGVLIYFIRQIRTRSE